MLKNRATRKEAYSSATIEGVHKSASSKNASPNSRILSLPSPLQSCNQSSSAFSNASARTYCSIIAL